MLKNCHMFYCSMVSFMFLYLFYLQDKGILTKSLILDNYSMFLFMMTFVCLMAVMWLIASKSESKWFTLINLSMLIMFFYMYMVCNFMNFYVVFELSVVPMMFYISTWGYSLDRVKAMMYMFMYTFFFSLPFLICFISESKNISFNINMSSMALVSVNQLLVMLSLLMFLVKIPIWGFHLWLPKAHVEASTEGSMILAGVVLKLAGIGMIKFSNLYETPMSNILMYILASMSIMGAILMGIYCVRQSDGKTIIALSSVVHMSFLFLCFMISSSLSFMAMTVVMIAHGIISPLMFLFLGDVYNSLSTRSLQNLKGSLKNILYMTALWFILCMFNMGLPLSMNFFGEMMFFFCSMSFSLKMTMMVITLIFINGIFNSFLLIFLTGGKEKEYLYTGMNTMNLSLMYMCLLFVLMLIFFMFEL